MTTLAKKVYDPSQRKFTTLAKKLYEGSQRKFAGVPHAFQALAHRQVVEGLGGSGAPCACSSLNLRWVGERIFEKAVDRFWTVNGKIFPQREARRAGKLFRHRRPETVHEIRTKGVCTSENKCSQELAFILALP